jgi:hypothetical protein
LFNGLKSLKKIKYLYIAVALIAVVGLGFSLGSIRDTGENAPNATSKTAVNESATNGHAVNQDLNESVNEAKDKYVIKKDTAVCYEYTYELCSHIYEEYKEPTKEMIGLDADGLAKMFPDAASTSIDKEGAHIKLTLNQICPQHVLLKLEGDKCVIYRNVLGTEKLKAEQEFTIDESKWGSEWLQSLKEGIIFESIEELESFVEDMES